MFIVTLSNLFEIYIFLSLRLKEGTLDYPTAWLKTLFAARISDCIAIAISFLLNIKFCLGFFGALFRLCHLLISALYIPLTLMQIRSMNSEESTKCKYAAAAANMLYTIFKKKSHKNEFKWQLINCWSIKAYIHFKAAIQLQATYTNDLVLCHIHLYIFYCQHSTILQYLQNRLKRFTLI